MTPPRRIGVNLLYLLPARGGMETVSRRLTGAMAELAPEREFVVYADVVTIERLRESEDWAAAVRFVRSPATARRKALRIAGELTWLPARARRDRIEVLFSQGNTGPAAAPMPMVTTIHDLLYRRFPGTHSRAVRLGLDLVVPRTARASSRLIAPSRATKEDLVAGLGLPAEKIDVIPMGPGRPPVAPASEERLRKELGLDRSRIILSIAVGFEHKNLARLLSAFAEVVKLHDVVMVQLGVVPSYLEEDLRRQACELGIAERVRFVERIDDAMLDSAYENAAMLVHPSLLEGFGLPLLEAMDRDCPVACSNASAMPEVVGDAAELFDPLSVPQITQAMLRLLEDPARREELIERGRRRLRRFSWRATAEATLATLDRAALSQ